jgi:SAM-dependent methyltransferase
MKRRFLAVRFVVVNENHARLCPSPEWADYIQNEVLPELTQFAALGDVMLELGPGPRAATEWLRRRVQRLVVVEADAGAADELVERFAETNVEVEVGDATDLEHPPETFDSVDSFTMLHHVPTVELQQQVIAEAFRVLRPGGAFLGSDSLASNELHLFHADDTYNPIEPTSLLLRLQMLGFAKITVVVDGSVKFVAHKPHATASAGC